MDLYEERRARLEERISRDYPGMKEDLLIEADIFYEKIKDEPLDALREHARAVEPRGTFTLDRINYILSKERQAQFAAVRRAIGQKYGVEYKPRN